MLDRAHFNNEIADLPELVRRFCMDKLVVENRSLKTVFMYSVDLRVFLKYCKVHKAGDDRLLEDPETFAKVDIRGLELPFFAGITTLDIYEFLTYTQSVRGNEWSARARKLSSVKSFYRFLTVKMHLLENDPAHNIDAPKPRKTLPKFMTLEEAQLFLDTVAGDTESGERTRNYAIVTLFLNCGMRLSELVGISLGDITPDMSSLRVLGKGAKERMIYLNEACRNALGEYLTERAGMQNIKDRDALFLSGRGTRISNQTVQWTVKKYLKLAGLENRKFSVHKLRHTAATLMYRSGKVDVRVLKDILGHEQLSTTQIYTHVSDDAMRAAMDNNPLSNVKAAKSEHK